MWLKSTSLVPRPSHVFKDPNFSRKRHGRPGYKAIGSTVYYYCSEFIAQHFIKNWIIPNCFVKSHHLPSGIGSGWSEV